MRLTPLVSHQTRRRRASWAASPSSASAWRPCSPPTTSAGSTPLRSVPERGVWGDPGTVPGQRRCLQGPRCALPLLPWCWCAEQSQAAERGDCGNPPGHPPCLLLGKLRHAGGEAASASVPSPGRLGGWVSACWLCQNQAGSFLLLSVAGAIRPAPLRVLGARVPVGTHG